MQETQSPFPPVTTVARSYYSLVPATAPLTSAASIVAAQMMDSEPAADDDSRDSAPLQIAAPSSQPTGGDLQQSASTQNTAANTKAPAYAGRRTRKSAQPQQVAQSRTTRQTQRSVDAATVDAVATEGAADQSIPSTFAKSRIPPAQRPATPTDAAAQPATACEYRLVHQKPRNLHRGANSQQVKLT